MPLCIIILQSEKGNNYEVQTNSNRIYEAEINLDE